MDKRQYSRTIGLLGEEAFLKLREKRIFLAGLGGVGGTAFEALLRMGFSRFVIVDKDEVALSNLNRQILFLHSDLNRSKVEVAQQRALAIDEEADITIFKGDVNEMMLDFHVDIMVDCIDDVKAKVNLIKFATNHNIPIVSSMGMANKMDASKLVVTTINKSTVDPLAKKLRYELKKEGVNYSDVDCVCSLESPKKDGTKLNSLITVTSTAGLLVAQAVLNRLNKQ